MFTAYFDASGNAVDQPFVVVSGYIASYIQWKFLENAWQELHAKYGLTLPFHAVEFMAAKNNRNNYKNQRNARPDYLAITDSPEEADKFLVNLAQLEAATTNCAVTSIVPMEIYNGVSSLLDLRQVIPPYALAARMCIELVRKWERLFDVPEPVECIFEAGDFEQGKFTRLMVEEGSPPPIYKDKKDFAGLQAADHYTWERASMSKLLKAATPTPTKCFQFLGTVPKLHIESTTTHLVNVYHLKRIDPKTGVQHGD